MEYTNSSSKGTFYYKRVSAIGAPIGGSSTAVTSARSHSQPTVISSNSDFQKSTRWGYRFNHDAALSLAVETINSVDFSKETAGGPCNAMTAAPLLSHLRNGVKAAALNNALEALRGNVDLSIDVAQARQTGDLIRLDRLAARVLQIARDVKKLHGKRALKGIGGLWLQAQYGLLPLLSTAHALAQPILHPSNDALRSVKGRSNASDKYASSNHSSLPLTGTRFRIVENRVIEYTERCEVKIVIRSPETMSLENMGHYTSLNPASIAWELLPFSFVADWFFDLGSFIRNTETAWLYASLFHDGYYTYTSVHKELTSECMITPTTGNSFKKKSFSPGGSLSVNVERFPLTAIPFPKLPPVKVDLGSRRLLNAAALLSQFLKR